MIILKLYGKLSNKMFSFWYFESNRAYDKLETIDNIDILTLFYFSKIQFIKDRAFFRKTFYSGV